MTTPPPPPAKPDRVRVTAVMGTLAAFAIAGSFFLDWIRVAPGVAEHLQADVREALERAETTTRAQREFEQMADTLATEGAMGGSDLIQWVRTAHAYNADLDAKAERVGPVDAAMQRRLSLLRVLLYALPLAGLLLGVYFLFHRFRRAKSPILILSLLAGGLAVVLAGALDYAHALVQRTLGDVADQVHLGAGVAMLLAGGTVLALVGVFGVTARNCVRVYAGSVLTACCLGLIVAHFLAGGFGS